MFLGFGFVFTLRPKYKLFAIYFLFCFQIVFVSVHFSIKRNEYSIVIADLRAQMSKKKYAESKRTKEFRGEPKHSHTLTRQINGLFTR